jgi:hypothetical protein
MEPIVEKAQQERTHRALVLATMRGGNIETDAPSEVG